MRLTRVVNKAVVIQFLLFAFLLISATWGRPLNEGSHSSSIPSSSLRFHGDVVRGFEVVLESMSIGAVKKSGPSPGGGGHRLPTTLGGIKNSGPSPGGGGHRLKETLGATKNSGPSPGEGHSAVSGNKH
ncbi:precursor of CEP16-like [Punica granatum]|uniref:Precursor of CEP16-like n=2 Tax=Punica granatum TaxID=22663 RepID=A0A6P8CHE3_PUNGR|nr:precursor of CEP16-like [Punica granatum]PKI33502.1 hypothetical protein CRG98_046058 [Punica granatum]